jgi:gluconokinase
MRQHDDVRSIVVMGVSGSGKSTIALALSKSIGGEFLDADSLHTPESVAKMKSAIALGDDDRWPWLKVVGLRIREFEADRLSSSTACSALKRRYREVLRNLVPNLFFVGLEGSPALIASRVATRASGILPPALLGSQFADLEPLEADERGLRVDVALSPAQIVDLVVAHFVAKP